MLGVPAVTAYVITSVNDKKKLASVLTFVWSSYSFSYIFAPATGGYLATFLGMQWVLRISAILAAFSTMTFFFLHSQCPKKVETAISEYSSSSTEEKRLWRKMLVWSAFFTIVTFLVSLARPYVQTLLDEEYHLGEFYVGLFGSINFAGVTFVGVVMGRLADRWRKSGAISLCLFLYVVSVVPLLLIRETTGLLLIAFLLGGSSVIFSLVSSFVGTIAPQAKQGLWVSIPQTLSMLAATAAPYLGGYLYTISPAYAFTASVIGIPFLALFALAKLRD